MLGDDGPPGNNPLGLLRPAYRRLALSEPVGELEEALATRD